MNALGSFLQTYSYLCIDIVLFFIWLVIFLNKKANKYEMLFFGITFGIAAMAVDMRYSLQDYWHPNFLFHSFLLESFLYGFLFSGICAQSFFLFFQKKERTTRKHHPIFVIVVLLSSVTAFLFLVNLLKLNSIMALIIPPLVVGGYIALKSPQMLKVEIFAGFFAVIATFVMYQLMLWFYPTLFTDNWYLNNLTGVLILKIPLEEYLFAFSLGFGLSMFYEYVTGKELVFKKGHME